MGGQSVLSFFLPSRVEKSHRWGASWAASALRAPVCCAMERLCDWSLTVEKGGGVIFEGPRSVSDESQFKAVQAPWLLLKRSMGGGGRMVHILRTSAKIAAVKEEQVDIIPEVKIDGVT